MTISWSACSTVQVHRRGDSTSALIQIRGGAAIHLLGPMNIGQRVYLY
jgi:hypothetical protein